MSSDSPDFILYTYFRSSCSARLRIALNLKSISYSSRFVNILNGEQKSTEYDEVNPSHSVPAIQIPGVGDFTITQSIAALEYFEERYGDVYPLLPPKTDVTGRAYVRTLVGIIASDTQPVTNLRILSRVSELGATKEQWARELMTDGLTAYERVASKVAGRFSFGDQITLADVCLVPAVWGAQRFGVDLDALPTVKRVFEELSKEDAVKKAHWKNQEDTPEDLRN